VTRKLSIETPPDTLIEAYMEEIARGYGVPYIPRLPMDDDSGDGPGGGLAVRNPTCFPEI
jgi:vacuolar protein sorting-associated protein IST1